MLTFGGINALSVFRAKSLLARLQAVAPSVISVQAEYVHLVDVKKPSASEQEVLQQLLTYGEPFTGQATKQQLVVVPRPGTISPWSSKATDIAHNAGLKDVDRVERATTYYFESSKPIKLETLAPLIHDRMTEAVYDDIAKAAVLFDQARPKSLVTVDIFKGGKQALVKANKETGLALADDEIDYLYDAYKELARNPTDTELMMFGQVNSEHCRHKIFNADWVIDGKSQPKSLFKMIKNTYEKGGQDVLSAYSDNAAVLKGAKAMRFAPNPKTNEYEFSEEPVHLVTKVETHNHPTAIAPFPGAATGAGGEIRDEGATGRGARPKMGLTGYSVSNLSLEATPQPWEQPYGKPGRIVSPLDIMIESPLGGAVFNNEFGRPNLLGYFRTFEQAYEGETWGYHKPIMIAGGLGNIREELVEKQTMQPGAQVIVLGGPSMLIGLGGGAASSMQTGASNEDLDFASVQRANAEIERRAQEVINTCVSLGKDNPIITIHDVGAGGLSNALPELVHDSGLGARFELRKVPNAEPGMSPMEIWCNEAQERYVLGVDKKDLDRFEAICERERCPFAVVGETTKEETLVVTDELLGKDAVNLPMSVLFGKPPKMTREFKRTKSKGQSFKTDGIDIQEAVKRVLQLPAVASKKFLITIGDRTVGGLTVRDQMVGPWQVPVSDVAVTSSGFESTTGEAMAMGERTPLALANSAASARMAIAETITNIAAARIDKLSDVKLSANWMAAAGYGQEDQNLYDAVQAVGEEFCPDLGITIPVGKDSLSMRTVWQEEGKNKSVTSPLSLIITGFAPVKSVKQTLTPQLQQADSKLLLVDLGKGANRLGGSALSQVYNKTGGEVPDADADSLKAFFETVQELNQKGLLLAYHDRSDGGLLATLCEMAFAGRTGFKVDLADLPGATLDRLFNEELGAVLQVKAKDAKAVEAQLKKALGTKCVYELGTPTNTQEVIIADGSEVVYQSTRQQLECWWADTSYQIQKLRDNPASAEQELQAIKVDADPGISPVVTFKLDDAAPKTRPRVAIFREQGVNGQVEMAAAFDKAGFTAVDVHLNDLMQGTAKLDDFVGLVACGGFSYGDVLGAGEGWAKTILHSPKLRKQFKDFFERESTFSLGVCNGCQMLSNLKELIPGAAGWPKFLRNSSEQFEARLVTVQVNDSPSIFFKDMEGSKLPIPVAHGEGRAVFASKSQELEALACLQYVDNYGSITEQYPFNPNGSALGVTGFTSSDGRATIMMPHPERGFLPDQYSWKPTDWTTGPWLKMFQNARKWVS